MDSTCKITNYGSNHFLLQKLKIYFDLNLVHFISANTYSYEGKLFL